jgi:hypothetical protein
VDNPAEPVRLGWAIVAIATLYLVGAGTAVMHLGLRRLVDPHWQRGLSYFRIGWRWINHALANFKLLQLSFWLEPSPDPYLCFASKCQAAKTVVLLSVLLFGDNMRFVNQSDLLTVNTITITLSRR